MPLFPTLGIGLLTFPLASVAVKVLAVIASPLVGIEAEYVSLRL